MAAMRVTPATAGMQAMQVRAMGAMQVTRGMQVMAATTVRV